MSAEGGSPGGRVYFVQAGEGGPIKIGWTGSSPRARMASLQTGNPEPLRLLASAPGAPEDERGLHERFAAHRMTGEWFRAAAEVVAFVDGVGWTGRERAGVLEEADDAIEPEGAQEIAEYVEAHLLYRQLEDDSARIGVWFSHGDLLDPEIERAIRDRISRARLMAYEEGRGYLAFDVSRLVDVAMWNEIELEKGPRRQVVQ